MATKNVIRARVVRLVKLQAPNEVNIYLRCGGNRADLSSETTALKSRIEFILATDSAHPPGIVHLQFKARMNFDQ